MSRAIQFTVTGLDEAENDALRMVSAAPGAVARGLNETLEQTRKRLVEEAKGRYAVSAAGARHLDDLKQRERASPSRLMAEMRISKMRNDLAYFETEPDSPLPGVLWRKAPPSGFMGHVLKSTPLKTLPGVSGRSKAFLAQFKSGHVGMVQRVLGSSSRNKMTATGKPRWTNKDGNVEKVETRGSPSAAAMINTVWPGRDQESKDFFVSRLEQLMRGE